MTQDRVVEWGVKSKKGEPKLSLDRYIKLVVCNCAVLGNFGIGAVDGVRGRVRIPIVSFANGNPLFYSSSKINACEELTIVERITFNSCYTFWDKHIFKIIARRNAYVAIAFTLSGIIMRFTVLFHANAMLDISVTTFGI